jgi:hypothetical protein
MILPPSVFPAPSVACKYKAKVEVSDSDVCTRLQFCSISYNWKRFYNEGPCSQRYNTFFFVIDNGAKSQCKFCPEKAKSNICDKAGAYRSGAPDSSTLVALITSIRLSRKLANDKHSSLSCPAVSDNDKIYACF